MSTGTDTLFASLPAFRRAFEGRLAGLLDDDVLGVFILVLANASFEAASFERLRGPLAAAFDRWCVRFDRGEPGAIDAAADDVAVFERLRALGFDGLGVTRWRRAGPWELQFNPLRALRPARMSTVRVDRLQQPFDRSGFHFNKGFLRREILWEGELAGTAVRLLYNKFPFAELHGLLVPLPAEERPQCLTADVHARVWAICDCLGRALPGLGFGYNAYGAFASVNHLHFQLFVRGTGRYPIEAPEWRHNGGSLRYPLDARRCDSESAALAAIEHLHAAGCAYNLLYRPGCCYVVPRRLQGSYAHSTWTGGFAWSEITGALTVFDAADFERLDAVIIEDEFARLRFRP